MTVSTRESDRRLHSVETLMYIPSMGLSGGYPLFCEDAR